MVSDNEIDSALLSNITTEWRKIAFVIGVTMMQLTPEKRAGRDDSYFEKRLVFLVEKGMVDSTGDLSQMRQCEVRLP